MGGTVIISLPNDRGNASPGLLNIRIRNAVALQGPDVEMRTGCRGREHREHGVRGRAAARSPFSVLIPAIPRDASAGLPPPAERLAELGRTNSTLKVASRNEDARVDGTSPPQKRPQQHV